jgi:cyclic pyranopterin phosphate synthase
MEALVAVAAAGLTLYDMCKAIDRSMTVESIRLIRKSGGKSGLWERPGQASPPTRGKREGRRSPGRAGG